MNKELLKQKVAKAILDYIDHGCVLGVGSGSTVNYFIEELKAVKHKIEGAIASSLETEKRLKAVGIPIWDLNSVNELPLYIDSADEINNAKQMIKGGGGALTREKIVASVAKRFICLLDPSKQVDLLGAFPVALEVIPMARSYVAREVVKLGGNPLYREKYITDNGNVILDVHHLKILDPIAWEEKLNNITGVVANGIFAKRPADEILLATEAGVIKQ